MKSSPLLDSSAQRWLGNSILAAHVEAFVEHFAQWMHTNRLAVECIDETSVTRFLADHLPRCNCPSPVPRVLRDLHAACGHLLHVLRNRGVIAERARATGPIADELRAFDNHMRSVQGLAARTCSAQTRIVGRLLARRFGTRPIVMAKLRPSDVRQFIADQLVHRGTVSNAAAVAAALRAYFRYRTVCCDRVHALAGVISSPAPWRLATLPRSLTNAEIERLLAPFAQHRADLRQDRQPQAGRRRIALAWEPSMRARLTM